MLVYVAFDGDKDAWAYRYMRGWSANSKVDFHLDDAHQIDGMTSRASDEKYVKGILRQRMVRSSVFVLLVGESTRFLYKYVRWEIELAIELQLPIIVVSLNNASQVDVRCPALLTSATAVHIPYKLAAIKHAVANWPTQVRSMTPLQRAVGAHWYPDHLHRHWLQGSE